MSRKKHKSDLRTFIHFLFECIKHEIRTIMKDGGVVMFFIIVPIAYPILYSWMYNNEGVKEVPTVFVDQSHSFLSRTFIRNCDATDGIKVVKVVSSLNDAQELQRQQECHAIVLLPENFAQQINRGEQGTVLFYADLSGMFYYKGVYSALTDVSLEIGKDIKIARMKTYTDKDESIASSPLEYESVSLFNPQNGYGTFILPAVLILIIQQTMILGVGMLSGTRHERRVYTGRIITKRTVIGGFANTLGRSFSYFFIYIATTAYTLLLIPHIFKLVQLADSSTLIPFLLPYLLSVTFFSMLISRFVKERESIILLMVFTSMPFLLLSGISWPTNALPGFWKVISWCIPSTSGINGFVKINSLGANLNDIRPELIALWSQVVVYFIINIAIQLFMPRKTTKK
ncbi:ABC transporter permease [Hoylesella nanceiensis]|uniref:ABC transporter permease n=1 Tax=Hoylesella nanceiensis TaxID=425941 RepID=UPI0028EC9872|nr:ABC transporter permease [Hoylesella nanceiensis]